MPYPVEEWTEICPECGGRGGGYDYLDTRYPIDNPPWVDCPFCGGEGQVTKTGYEGSSRDLPGGAPAVLREVRDGARAGEND